MKPSRPSHYIQRNRSLSKQVEILQLQVKDLTERNERMRQNVKAAISLVMESAAKHPSNPNYHLWMYLLATYFFMIAAVLESVSYGFISATRDMWISLMMAGVVFLICAFITQIAESRDEIGADA